MFPLWGDLSYLKNNVEALAGPLFVLLVCAAQVCV
jgi:hypothetical protein